MFGSGPSGAPAEANYMDWRQEQLDRLPGAGPGGGGVWLAGQREKRGAAALPPPQATPCWPTSLAMLLWQTIGDRDKYGAPIAQAVEWTLRDRGKPHPQRPYVGP